MKTHYSIADLLALKLSGFPTTRRGWEYLVKTNNWKYREVPSRGKGGIRKEYEVNSEIRSFLHLNEIKSQVNSEVKIQEIPTQVICTQQSNELLNWQRDIAESRLFVVRYIQQKIKQGMKKTPAIEQFIADADALLLPEEMQLTVQKANAKAGEGRTISRRSIFDWIKAVDDAEKHKINVISILAPKARQTEIPVWAVELLKLWAQPQKPTLPAVLELLPNYLKANVPCPTYNQAYRFSRVRRRRIG